MDALLAFIINNLIYFVQRHCSKALINYTDNTDYSLRNLMNGDMGLCKHTNKNIPILPIGILTFASKR